MDEFSNIGKIYKAHSITGELKASLKLSLIAQDQFPDHVFIQHNNGILPYFVESVTFHHNGIILKLEGITDRKSAEDIQKCEIFLESDLVKDYFETEEKPEQYGGYSIFSENNQLIGLVNSVIEHPAHLTLSVIRDDKEILLPFVSEMVLSVDHDKREIIYKLPDGLLELYS